MKKKTSIIILLLIASLSLFAETLTLDEVKNLALENNLSFKSATEDLKNANATKYSGYSIVLPSVNATANKNYNDPSPDATNLGVNLTQPIFSGGSLIYGVINANKTEDISENNFQQNKLQTIADAETKYFSVLEAKNQLDVAQNNVKKSQQQLENGKIRKEAGSLAETDFLRLQIDFSNQETNLLRVKNQYDIAKQNLADFIQVDDFELEAINTNQIISEIDKFSQKFSSNEAITNDLISFGQDNSLDVKNSQINSQLNKNYLRMRQGSLLPSVSLTASQNWQKSEFDDDYSDSQTIGISASMSLFPAQKIADIKVQHHKYKSSNLAYENSKQQKSLDIQNKYSTLVTSAKTVKTNQISLEQAEKLFEISEVKYEAGMLSTIDFLDATIQFQNSENSYISSFYQYLKDKKALELSLSISEDEELWKLIQKK